VSDPQFIKNNLKSRNRDDEGVEVPQGDRPVADISPQCTDLQGSWLFATKDYSGLMEGANCACRAID
jgi:hypothetical protein